jgi:putative hydrolase of the HAD superfamily
MVALGARESNMIKAIIFDCFGVLIKSGHNLLRQDFPELRNLVDELQTKSDLGILNRYEFNEIIASKTNLTAQEIDDRYWGTNKYNYPVIEIAENFKATGQYKVALLSNISRDWMTEILNYFDNKNLFDEVVLSGDVNIIKPDQRIFKLMADKLNLQPDECIMIDDLASNINGARLAGMHGVVFFSPEQLIDDINKILDQNNA